MNPDGKVQVKVRSRRVPVATFQRTEPFYSSSGVLVGYKPVTHVLFGNSLDQEHRRTIAEAQRLASSLGLGLEVVDDSRLGILGRLLSRFNGGIPRHPAVVVSPPTDEMPTDPSPVLTNGS
jgi:hypothetical protein